MHDEVENENTESKQVGDIALSQSNKMAQALKSIRIPAKQLDIEDSKNPHHWAWETYNCGEEVARLVYDTALGVEVKKPVEILPQPYLIRAYLEYEFTDNATNVDQAYAYFGFPPPPEVGRIVTLKHKNEVELGEVRIDPSNSCWMPQVQLVARLWGLDIKKSKSGLIVRAIKFIRLIPVPK